MGGFVTGADVIWPPSSVARVTGGCVTGGGTCVVDGGRTVCGGFVCGGVVTRGAWVWAGVE